ncbi:unnamed protein product [Heligmosomoides polygyrus]|uniref:Uncharacterized protein n=1 Tax=Heligmosomoides polygyrus TaxID=6339 RepID=A0A183FTZ2_HELPZ|nr:unnamed protein product [Heligmosomoides polygyrus]
MEVAPGQEVAPNGRVEEERSALVAVAESRGTRSVTNMSKNADMLDVDLEEEFRKLCGGHPEPMILQVCNRLERAIKDMEVLVIAEVAKAIRLDTRAELQWSRESAIIQRWVEVVLQSLESESRTEENGALLETARCQRSELEELREAKRQLEQRELELQQLRAAMDTQGASRIVGTEAKNSVKYRRGADVLKILRSESKATDETKAFQGSHRGALRATAPRDGQRPTQPGHGAGRRTLGEPDYNSERYGGERE